MTMFDIEREFQAVNIGSPIISLLFLKSLCLSAQAPFDNDEIAVI